MKVKKKDRETERKNLRKKEKINTDRETNR